MLLLSTGTIKEDDEWRMRLAWFFLIRHPVWCIGDYSAWSLKWYSWWGKMSQMVKGWRTCCVKVKLGNEGRRTFCEDWKGCDQRWEAAPVQELPLQKSLRFVKGRIILSFNRSLINPFPTDPQFFSPLNIKHQIPLSAMNSFPSNWLTKRI
jgi:hypothetical protein